jgi:hypothetical protein
MYSAISNLRENCVGIIQSNDKSKIIAVNVETVRHNHSFIHCATFNPLSPSELIRHHPRHQYIFLNEYERCRNILYHTSMCCRLVLRPSVSIVTVVMIETSPSCKLHGGGAGGGDSCKTAYERESEWKHDMVQSKMPRNDAWTNPSTGRDSTTERCNCVTRARSD